ncbi:glycosyl transferase [Phreatobacter cathodiphilus]|uniref:Glycosyl transferase n=1 Tax=Phreatobacter cathodiphilus TaxID=1868589 RepID=A0A2S0NBK2_9HYPH|nr:glycosyl transferase [Phreatobacter cathodiphilus]AVO45538.1 glycosyl transferase [Phreatobacter cathodiphilus]
MHAVSSLATVVAAVLLSWLAIAALRPWLARVAAAKPDARSSHRAVTPQGAGLGVVAAIVLAGGTAVLVAGAGEPRLLALLTAMVGLAALGFVDDRRPLPWRPKLAAQALAAALAVAGLPAEASLVPPALFWVERAAAALMLVATVNLVNFVDGIDEITLAHAAPAFALAALVPTLSSAGAASGPLAAAGLGAMLGFWPWNRHPAKIFLGDSGSLPLGLLLGWLALDLALSGSPAAGLLMLLYPLADGGITLLRRFRAGARLTEPHRDHAYQRAVDGGVRAPRVALTVAAVSAAGAALALLSVRAGNPLAAAGLLALGVAVVLIPILSWLRRPGRPA